ncbi:MAG: DUF6314 family protein [Ignavibacteriaceae bacterium]
MFSQKKVKSIFSCIKELSTKSYNSNNILTHSFSGKVETGVTLPNEIIFNEFVCWNNDESLLITSKNIYCWTILTTGNIKLAHLRFGKNNPVFLVKLTQTNESHWESLKPYNCNNDLYSARLKFEKEKLILRWSVKGPTKNYYLETIYS